MKKWNQVWPTHPSKLLPSTVHRNKSPRVSPSFMTKQKPLRKLWLLVFLSLFFIKSNIPQHLTGWKKPRGAAPTTRTVIPKCFLRWTPLLPQKTSLRLPKPSAYLAAPWEVGQQTQNSRNVRKRVVQRRHGLAQNPVWTLPRKAHSLQTSCSVTLQIRPPVFTHCSHQQNKNGEFWAPEGGLKGF